MKLYIASLDTGNITELQSQLTNVNTSISTLTLHRARFKDGKIFILYDNIIPDPVKQFTLWKVTTSAEETAVKNFVNGKDIDILEILDNDIILILS